MLLSLNSLQRVLLTALGAFALTAAVLIATRGADPAPDTSSRAVLPSQPRPGARSLLLLRSMTSQSQQTCRTRLRGR